jgi:hypothetical protein
MEFSLFLVLLGLPLISCVFVLNVADRAPEGYEDTDGFHFGPPPT